MTSLRLTFLGLSITSSWGNGHATTYRALLQALHKRGHEVTFLERDVPWYAANRDLERPQFCRVRLYRSLRELRERYTRLVRDSDAVIVGSYVPRGASVGAWVLRVARGITAFYDIDTPVTLSRLSCGACLYLRREQIAQYGLYLSFTGGPLLRRLEREFGSPMARALYCSVDPAIHFPHDAAPRWDLGYLGTYSRDRQVLLQRLFIEPARQWRDGAFVLAGPQYPPSIRWPGNVERIDHLPPDEHTEFYTAQRFTLNATRADMRKVGYSPSVRLFEAAACATPIISDPWPGLSELFTPDQEILIAHHPADVLSALRELPERKRLAIGRAARRRVLAEHTADHRAAELERHIAHVLDERSRGRAACLTSK